MDTHQKVDSMLPLTHLSFLILLALSQKRRHGYSVIKAVEELSDPPIKPRTGTFYSALKRMMEEGLLAECGPPRDEVGEDERRRYYRITALGREALAAEAARLESLVSSARSLDVLPKGNL